jgi:hypothetical protein
MATANLFTPYSELQWTFTPPKGSLGSSFVSDLVKTLLVTMGGLPLRGASSRPFITLGFFQCLTLFTPPDETKASQVFEAERVRYDRCPTVCGGLLKLGRVWLFGLESLG